jgi:hypothetical protein
LEEDIREKGRALLVERSARAAAWAWCVGDEKKMRRAVVGKDAEP